ncbi:MAG: DUF1566 domain-containing protein [Hydrogenophaga sp.]|nr:DUF1566 domain-containing protein [Hydrogenophaga sp.]
MPAFRFYNSSVGSHFYTSSVMERDQLIALATFLSYEGQAFMVSNFATSGLSVVHRFLNLRNGVHFYTISEDEKAFVSANLPQFQYEGPAFLASQVPGAGLKPLHRFYLRSKGYHFYTASESEKARIEANLSAIYTYEGVAYYVLEQSTPEPFVGALPHSGVTNQQCYQAGSSTLVPCDSPGALSLSSQQDGHRVSQSAMSYSELPNGSGGTYARTECVVDNVTGLVWEGKAADGTRAGSATFTHYTDPTVGQRYDGTLGYVRPTLSEINALTNSLGYVSHVNSIALCGFTDWRLPERSELVTLVNYGITGAGLKIQTDWFPHTSTNGYWTKGITGPSSWLADFVDFGTGQTRSGERNAFPGIPKAIRLVRGPGRDLQAVCPSIPTAWRFVLDGDLVTDRKTGLIWGRCGHGQSWNGSACTGSASSVTHEQALQQVPAGGWRLPNVKELASLADPWCGAATIDTAAFPGTTATRYWSASPVVDDPAQVWTVDFSSAHVSPVGRSGSSTSQVRWVRTPS